MLSSSAGFSQSDVTALQAAGVNVFSQSPVFCLYGFVTPVPKTTDAIYWQATAAVETMALVNDTQPVLDSFLFAPIDGQGTVLTDLQGDLAAVIQSHWNNNALYGDTASDAGSVSIGTNTANTEQAGELLVTLNVRISPYVDTVAEVITVLPLTQAVPQVANS